MTILVTGAAGFIGSNFVLDWLKTSSETVINLDKLTYAGNRHNLVTIQDDPRHTLVQGDIGDQTLVPQLLATHRPRAILNFAAESHVDRSIHGPGEFIQTNIVGTFHLLEAARDYWMQLEDAEKANFRFLHVSTDEVYGTLTASDAPFTEQNRYEPNSPYSASKAASDHLVRAWHHTYGLPVLTTNCSNNYGPYHFPEKLIPLTITNALAGKPLPIYGMGCRSAIGSMSATIAAASVACLKPALSERPTTSAGGMSRRISVLCKRFAPYSTSDGPAQTAHRMPRRSRT